jgi:hypothetical protein
MLHKMLKDLWYDMGLPYRFSEGGDSPHPPQAEVHDANMTNRCKIYEFTKYITDQYIVL